MLDIHHDHARTDARGLEGALKIRNLSTFIVDLAGQPGGGVDYQPATLPAI